jgi:hypothetical protein
VAETTHLNFDLVITRRAGNGRYHLQVRSPGGNPHRDLELPLPAEELADLRALVQGRARDVIRAGRRPRPADRDAREAVRRLGQRLFDGVFSGDVSLSFSISLRAADQRRVGLRVRLWLDDAPELGELPWEYLYNPSTRKFLALSVETPVVRFLSLPNPAEPLLVEPPLQMLVMISDPKGLPRLKVEDEWETIDRAFKELQDAELVSIHRVPRGTVGDLQDHLARATHHVFHFIGHGDFDPRTGEAYLLMEGPGRRASWIDNEALSVALDHPSLRLVILNSCEGARGDGHDPFGGLAQSLVKKGIPAALAMQFKITDDAAIVFAKKLFGTMAHNRPVDTALVEARKAIRLESNETEWGAPVLYMNAPDGQIFQFDPPTAEERLRRQVDKLTAEAHAAIDGRNYSLAVQKLQAIKGLLPETM